ncbi:MAG: LCP family protein [Eubacteriales bacterium]|nr:LCP family protein [Eubacteriales bacterium]
MKKINIKKNDFSAVRFVAAFLFAIFLAHFCAYGTYAETERINADESNVEKAQHDGIYNVLLIGSDHRDNSWNGNSDVMILVTIQPEQKRIVLTSFMRDLRADIPGYGVHKLNYAYAAGGADTLIAALENNYELHIDNYAVVDFDSMAAIINIFGGVDMTVSDEEVKLINGYAACMDYYNELPYGQGEYHLDGYQAVAYMRIRYVGNNDYERTQRQRNVLRAIFEKKDQMSPDKLLSLAAEVLANVEHNLTAANILTLSGYLPLLSEAELVENRIPYDGLFTSSNEMLVPDMEPTLQKLHEILMDK